MNQHEKRQPEWEHTTRSLLYISMVGGISVNTPLTGGDLN